MSFPKRLLLRNSVVRTGINEGSDAWRQFKVQCHVVVSGSLFLYGGIGDRGVDTASKMVASIP